MRTMRGFQSSRAAFSMPDGKADRPLWSRGKSGDRHLHVLDIDQGLTADLPDVSIVILEYRNTLRAAAGYCAWGCFRYSGFGRVYCGCGASGIGATGCEITLGTAASSCSTAAAAGRAASA